MEKFSNEVKLRVASNASNKELKDAAIKFSKESFLAQYSYNFSWLGRPIIQYPQDILAVQEVIWDFQPDLIIETGIAHGGSLILSASMLCLLDCCEALQKDGFLDLNKPQRRVIGVDIDIRAHNRILITEHPMSNRIDLLEGSSIDEKIISKVYSAAKGFDRIMVFLDSNHSHEHVLAELEAYAPLVSPGGYLVVFDTMIDELDDDCFKDRPWGSDDNPKTALRQFLLDNKDFQIDKDMNNKLIISVAKDGYLKKV